MEANYTIHSDDDLQVWMETSHDETCYDKKQLLLDMFGECAWGIRTLRGKGLFVGPESWRNHYIELKRIKNNRCEYDQHLARF